MFRLIVDCNLKDTNKELWSFPTLKVKGKDQESFDEHKRTSITFVSKKSMVCMRQKNYRNQNVMFMLCYEFLSSIASSVLKVNCYRWESCVGGSSAFNSPFRHRSYSHNIRPLDNHHVSGLSIKSGETHTKVLKFELIFWDAH